MSYKIKSIECQQEYAQKVKKFINESNNLIQQTIKHDVSKYFNTKKFKLCNRRTYQALIHFYNINEMNEFVKYDKLNFEDDVDNTFINPDSDMPDDSCMIDYSHMHG